MQVKIIASHPWQVRADVLTIPVGVAAAAAALSSGALDGPLDRKSTRLNSSH